MIHELKAAFQQARAENNIDVILPVFLRTRLAVVVKTFAPDEPPSFYLVSSPAKHMCVTCAVDAALLARIPNLEVEWMDGRSIIERITPAMEIVIVWDDGGDFINQEQLKWYRGLMAENPQIS